jgi:hypothetical protein
MMQPGWYPGPTLPSIPVYWVLRGQEFRTYSFLYTMSSICCLESDKSGSGHHSNCEIVTLVFIFGVLWGVPHQGRKQLDGTGVNTIHTYIHKVENNKKLHVHLILIYLNNYYLGLCVHLYWRHLKAWFHAARSLGLTRPLVNTLPDAIKICNSVLLSKTMSLSPEKVKITRKWYGLTYDVQSAHIGTLKGTFIVAKYTYSWI